MQKISDLTLLAISKSHRRAKGYRVQLEMHPTLAIFRSSSRMLVPNQRTYVSLRFYSW